jgi:flagellar biosynthesis/type III secretory pathway chaperone
MDETTLLAQALERAANLRALLEKEFEALKSQQLDTFESLQQEKLDILTFLGSDTLSNYLKSQTKGGSSAATAVASWDNIITIVAECKDLHRRNQILINRKIESVKGALQTIQSPNAGPSVEVYDRLGKVKSRRSSNTTRNA